MDDDNSLSDSETSEDMTSSSSTSSEDGEHERMATALMLYSELVLSARDERVFRTRLIWDDQNKPQSFRSKGTLIWVVEYPRIDTAMLHSTPLPPMTTVLLSRNE